jgi:hypothetical protein
MLLVVSMAPRRLRRGKILEEGEAKNEVKIKERKKRRTASGRYQSFQIAFLYFFCLDRVRVERRIELHKNQF